MAQKALIIDDSRSCQAILQKLLQRYSFEVDCADTGEQGIQLLNNTPIDVVFLDHTLPGKDGLEVLGILKTDRRTRHIPVVMYTAQESSEYRNNALAQGATAVLNKNISDSSLNNILNIIHLNPVIAPAPQTQTSEIAPTLKREVAASSIEKKTTPGALKQVTPIADTPSDIIVEKSTRQKEVLGPDFEDIFNRAKFDHLTHKIETLQLAQARSTKMFSGFLLLLSLPLLWLLFSSVGSSATPSANKTINKNNLLVERQLSEQQTAIGELNSRLTEQQSYFEALQTTQTQLSVRQQEIQSNLSRTASSVDDLRYNIQPSHEDGTSTNEQKPKVKQTTRGTLDGIEKPVISTQDGTRDNNYDHD